ncbi:MAG: Asp-tRNA(Asn)/Glu-tRNA(Gln) amidotransferase subunit GatB [Firmicutes bacterium]|nr:Asp-tRNA(Asn)/Glu-tRNA(Gln) amidotransferase subunit GatB [Bacillota bacterium]
MLVPTIGIEVHVELKSKAKVYSQSKNEFSYEPNTNVSLIDLGYPGTLPKLNYEVIEMALKAALALHCKINQEMHFDRKNYFYPDLPKGFQITQNMTPIGYDGYLEIDVNGCKKQIGIERIHIEEDTCKSIHGESGTLLNFNRAGVPLVEIVSKPVIATPEEAVLYLEKLRETLLYLGISDVKIEEGSMRCDANISLHEEGTEFGTKCEIKNIGSISNVGISLNYEMKRQQEILERGEKILQEETRRFDDKANKTILMRTKETGNDYRYFPEPDLPMIHLSDEEITRVKELLPVMPDALREKYQSLGLNQNQMKTIIASRELCSFYESILDKCDPIVLANYLTGDILSFMNREKISVHELKITDEILIDFVSRMAKKEFSSKQGKEILVELLTDGGTVDSVVDKLGIVQISDTSVIEKTIQEIVSANPDSVKDYHEGKDRAIKFLMGQVMKATKGQANPSLAMELLKKELSK